MRRMLALAALSAALLTAAACSNDNNTGSGTNSPTSAAPTSASDNTKEVCAAAEKAITDGQQQFATELTKAMSGSAADQNAAIQALKTLFTQWMQGLRTEAARADNAELKTALTTFADELQKAADGVKTPQDLQNLDLETSAMKSASDTIDRLCG